MIIDMVKLRSGKLIEFINFCLNCFPISNKGSMYVSPTKVLNTN